MSSSETEPDDRKWNDGMFWDGHRARCDGHLITACPSSDVVGRWCAASWRAGWADADADRWYRFEDGDFRLCTDEEITAAEKKVRGAR